MKTKALAKRPMAARSERYFFHSKCPRFVVYAGPRSSSPVYIFLSRTFIEDHGVMISGVLLDLAGVIYEGEGALPGALDAVDRLRQAGLSLRFVTNTTRMTKHMVLQRLLDSALASTRVSSLHPLRVRGNGWLETIVLLHFSFIQIWPRNSKMIRIAFIAQSWSAMSEKPSTMQVSIARFVI